MSPRRRPSADVALLDLWRPPEGSGDAIGCLTTTYTFQAEHFDRYCLGQFLGIEAEPEREGLAYMLEREAALSKAYAGVLVDHAHCQGTHSLRWDLLPVRVPRGIQHAKVSLLVWNASIRTIITSANMTEQGYRQNRELASAIDHAPGAADLELLGEILAFFEVVIEFVPHVGTPGPAASRARQFVADTRQRIARWSPRTAPKGVRLLFAPTIPARPRQPMVSAWEAARDETRRGRSSIEGVGVVSPFFDANEGTDLFTELYGTLGRRGPRQAWVAVAAETQEADDVGARLRIGRGVVRAAEDADVHLELRTLPEVVEGERRPWHAKALQLHGTRYDSILVGSSNCTSAGLGIGGRANLEANLLYVIDTTRSKASREFDDQLWTEELGWVERPDEAEWLGSGPEAGEVGAALALPAGFVAARVDGGNPIRIRLALDPRGLPPRWEVSGVLTEAHHLLDQEAVEGWTAPGEVEVVWDHPYPPARLRVTWDEGLEAEWPLNISDPSTVPPPPELGTLTAEQMLSVIAASDPGAALRALARRREADSSFDADVDSATPIDLDPLRRYNLGDTFLHVVRRRARLFARFREHLERPVWSDQALEGRLQGLLGARALMERFWVECREDAAGPDVALLKLADLLQTLSEVQYVEAEGALRRPAFEARYARFLAEIAAESHAQIGPVLQQASGEATLFWNTVVTRCAEVQT